MKGFTRIELISVVLTLSFLGLIGWTAIHFISKFW